MDEKGSNTHTDAAAMSIVQRGNLKTLEQTLRKQWRLGQNIVLCWSADERGLLVVMVPHYFLGNYCAGDNHDNEEFVRELISGSRRRSRDDMFAISKRLEVAPTFIKLSSPLSDEAAVLNAVEQMICRYGVSYVDSRAVLLFDIVEFSLFTPFEQASQLNSLSYSFNSAYNKLASIGIDIDFARTTTGDGYYVWNKSLGPEANRDLFYFMLLVVADNAVARAASKGNTVPRIRTAYHVGGHYELYQAAGVNPSVFSYIVGDVTIELARMVDTAVAEQILVGEFDTSIVDSNLGSQKVPAPAFVSACNRGLAALAGVQLSGKRLNAMRCQLTEYLDCDATRQIFRLLITDKHGLSRYAHNLQVSLDLEGRRLELGLEQARLNSAMTDTAAPEPRQEAVVPDSALEPAASAEELFDDLAQLLARRRQGGVGEE
ncbi:hypothetical protein A3709_14795 [Halioglobus sp. HI00S01]|uniref:hypothetical protein n=1 Tax=Halioglobus sp. HI00S01 TaxID=1822214 RepID=UPI0007C35684|nr:hypothetical protein [Halioglobus sp. HI00S01]KZX59551.1 hypothetical protein A3709_14795 [Halioglobus sp. HI00S01]